jgi:hypothetical protein
VVLKVAREYFDSASSCRDSAWSTARRCLALIPLDQEEEEEEEEEEQDAPEGDLKTDVSTPQRARMQWQRELRKEQLLIEAVEKLDTLGLDPLPVQIRQAKDALAIISRVIAEAPGMLRRHQELLRLGHLLGLSSRTQQSRILELVVRALVRESDARSAATGATPDTKAPAVQLTEAAPLLTQLVAGGWGEVWDICERLALEEASGLREDERLAFLAHALAHCPQQHAQRILGLWRAVRDKVHLSCHGGLPQDAPAVAAWMAGEGFGDGTEVWARAPQMFPILHGFYTSDVPGAFYTPLDPYFQVLDDQDIRARAVQETLREAITALAACAAIGDAARGRVLWQRFAAAAAQGDAVLLLAVIFASSPHDLVALFHHLLAAQISAEFARGDTVKAAHVANLEATAWLACVACHCLQAAATGDLPPHSPLTQLWEAASQAACKGLAVEDSRAAAAYPRLREAFGKVSAALGGGGGGVSSVGAAAVWGVLFEYFEVLRLALADMRMRDVGMTWTLRAACEPASDPAALLRLELSLSSAKVAPTAEQVTQVLAAAAVLHNWMPLDDISESAVLAGAHFTCCTSTKVQILTRLRRQAALSARQLSIPRNFSVGSSAGAGKETASSLLKDSSPGQRLKVAKELLESGTAERSLVLEVLASVDAEVPSQDDAVRREAQVCAHGC